MSTPNTDISYTPAKTNSPPEILEIDGDFKNEKELNMINYNEHYVIVDTTNLSNISEIVLDHISSTLIDEGIDYFAFDNICLVLERSPEHITIESCDCCGSVRINADVKVSNPSGHSPEFVEEHLGTLMNDEWCETSSFSDEEGHTVSLSMIVPCDGYALLNFSTTMEDFERKLKTFIEEASKLGLEIVLDEDADADPVAASE